MRRSDVPAKAVVARLQHPIYSREGSFANECRQAGLRVRSRLSHNENDAVYYRPSRHKLLINSCAIAKITPAGIQYPQPRGRGIRIHKTSRRTSRHAASCSHPVDIVYAIARRVLVVPNNTPSQHSPLQRDHSRTEPASREERTADAARGGLRRRRSPVSWNP